MESPEATNKTSEHRAKVLRTVVAKCCSGDVDVDNTYVLKDLKELRAESDALRRSTNCCKVDPAIPRRSSVPIQATVQGLRLALRSDCTGGYLSKM